MRILSLMLLSLIICQGEACAQGSAAAAAEPTVKAEEAPKPAAAVKAEEGLKSESAAPAKAKCPAAKHAKIPKVKNLGLAKAKKAILAAGWKPHETMTSETAVMRDKEYFDLGYKEVEYCSGTGVAACGFLYKDKYGNILRMTTVGEDPSPRDATIACDL